MKRDSVDFDKNWQNKLNEKLVSDDERNEANILHNLIVSCLDVRLERRPSAEDALAILKGGPDR
jgi:hypothetical protein